MIIGVFGATNHSVMNISWEIMHVGSRDETYLEKKGRRKSVLILHFLAVVWMFVEKCLAGIIIVNVVRIQLDISNHVGFVIIGRGHMLDRSVSNWCKTPKATGEMKRDHFGFAFAVLERRKYTQNMEYRSCPDPKRCSHLKFNIGSVIGIVSMAKDVSEF